MNKLTLSLVIVFFLLLSPTLSVDWQGYGNMSSSNLTIIWGFINQNIGNALSKYTGASSTSLDDFNTNFSNHLNALWSPAWNIFTLYDIPYDSIVYGYAFRDHWMWYNNYQVNGKRLNFIIWKDYNCQGWKTVGINSLNQGFSDDEKGQIFLAFDSIRTGTVEDIWKITKEVMNYIDNSSILGKSNKAYSIITAQFKSGNSAGVYGRVCLVENRSKFDVFDYNKNPYWGVYVLFQTR